MNMLTLDKMDRCEIKKGIFLIGEPTPIEGTNKMIALADVHWCLCVIELSITFGKAGAHG